MKRWNPKGGKDGYGEMVENAKIDAFIAEVLEVSKKHGFSIGHEDGHGAFEVGVYNSHDCEWLQNAMDTTKEQDDLK